MNAAIFFYKYTEGCSPSLWVLLAELDAVEKKWFRIGLGLGVKEKELEKIEESKEDCLRKALQECLKQVNLTWDDVVGVLSSKAMKEYELANHLRKKFCSSFVPGW